MQYTNEQLVAMIQDNVNKTDNLLILWQQVERFVRKSVKKYQKYAEMDDLIQEGYLAMCKAAENYNSEKEAVFITYLGFWVKQTIQRYVENCCGCIRMPSYVIANVNRYVRAEGEYMKEYGREPTRNEMAAYMDVDEKTIEQMQECVKMARIGSIDKPTADSDELTISDTIASDQDLEEDIAKKYDTELMKSELLAAVKTLPNKQPEIIQMRYYEGRTIKEISAALDINGSAVSMENMRALILLKNPKKSGGYKRYYEQYISSCGFQHVGVEAFNRTWTSEVEREALKHL